MAEVNYLMTVTTSPQTYWSPRTDNVNPCDTALLPDHQSIRIKLTTHPDTPPLKMLFPKPIRELGFFEH